MKFIQRVNDKKYCNKAKSFHFKGLIRKIFLVNRIEIKRVLEINHLQAIFTMQVSINSFQLQL